MKLWKPARLLPPDAQHPQPRRRELRHAAPPVAVHPSHPQLHPFAILVVVNGQDRLPRAAAQERADQEHWFVRREETEVEPRQLRTLYELSASASRAIDPGELVKVVAEHACELLRGDAVALFLWDDSAGVLVPVYTNDPHEQPEDNLPLRLGQGALLARLVGRLQQSRQAGVQLGRFGITA